MGRVNKSPKVSFKETDLTFRADTFIPRANRTAGSYNPDSFIDDDSISVTTTTTTVNPTTTTTTTEEQTTTTTTTVNPTTTTTTTEEQTTTTTTTVNDGCIDFRILNNTGGQANVRYTDCDGLPYNVTMYTTIMNVCASSIDSYDEGVVIENQGPCQSPTTTTTTTAEETTTTTTTAEPTTTTTTTIDYSLVSYMIVWRRNTVSNGMTYDFTLKDENDNYILSDYDIKCIYDTFGQGGGNFWNIALSDSNEEYLSVGDDSLVRVNLADPTDVIGEFNTSTRGVYNDSQGRFGQPLDQYIITIESGVVTSIVSFDSIGDVSGCTPYTTTTTTAEPTTTTTTTAEETTTTTTTLVPTTTTTTTAEETTTTTTTLAPTTTTTTTLAPYQLTSNYSSNGYTFRESNDPTSQIVTQDSVMGAQSGATLTNESYLHTGISISSYTVSINGRSYGGSMANFSINFSDTPYITGDGSITVNRINTSEGVVLQVTTNEVDPNSTYNIDITVS